jgi:excisionase family DNA binding protein
MQGQTRKFAHGDEEMKGAKLMQNATSDMPERLNATLDETAAHFKVSRRTIQMWQERGLLKAVKFGRLRRFRWAEIKKLEKTGIE